MNGYLESRANESFQSLRTACEDIYKDYKKYGEVVLDKELEGEDPNLRSAFYEENEKDFCDKLFKYWAPNHQILIKNFKDFEKIPKRRINDKIYLERRDKDIVIAKNLFRWLAKRSSRLNVFVLANEKLYVIEVVDSFQEYICIKDVYPAESIIIE